MRVEVLHNATVVATLDLAAEDTFVLQADGAPIVGILANHTVLTWPTLTAIVAAASEHLAQP